MQLKPAAYRYRTIVLILSKAIIYQCVSQLMFLRNENWGQELQVVEMLDGVRWEGKRQQ